MRDSGRVVGGRAFSRVSRDPGYELTSTRSSEKSQCFCSRGFFPRGTATNRKPRRSVGPSGSRSHSAKSTNMRSSSDWSPPCSIVRSSPCAYCSHICHAKAASLSESSAFSHSRTFSAMSSGTASGGTRVTDPRVCTTRMFCSPSSRKNSLLATLLAVVGEPSSGVLNCFTMTIPSARSDRSDRYARVSSATSSAERSPSPNQGSGTRVRRSSSDCAARTVKISFPEAPPGGTCTPRTCSRRRSVPGPSSASTTRDSGATWGSVSAGTSADARKNSPPLMLSAELSPSESN
mmetsp:Transcript_17911/g.50460  ORF Transcript_17911/g.50460 Transcript_17911/m.50460 type:complete len:291 (-) Transcript_17911:9-881(-)